MMLKFVPVCSCLDALSDGIIFLPYQNVQFWLKTMDYSQAFWPKLRPFFVVFILNSMEVARKMKLASFCSS